MTVETTNVQAGPYLTDGSATAFPFAFKALSTGEVSVEINGFVVDPSLYTVSLSAQGGTVVFGSSPSAGGSLYVMSDPSFEQTISFSNQSPFLPDSHNEANDRGAVRDLVLLKRVNDVATALNNAVAPNPESASSVECGAYDPTATNEDIPLGINILTIIKSFLGTRQAHVLDYAGWDETGTHDNAALFQRAVNDAAAAGVPLNRGKGTALLGSPIGLPPNLVYKGLKIDPDQPGNCSMFHIAHSGNGMYTTGGQFSGGLDLRELAFDRTQPASVPGQPWTPAAFGYDLYCQEQSRLHIDGLLFMNATQGFYLNGGDNRINRMYMQAYTTGFFGDWSYDTLMVTNSRWFSYGNPTPEMLAYMQTHYNAIALSRTDNAMFSNCMVFDASVGSYINRYPGDGTGNRPAGTAAKLKLSNVDFDKCRIGYYVDPAADGHTATFENVTIQGLDTPAAAPSLQIAGPNTKITGTLTVNRAGGNAVRMEASSAGSLVGLGLRVDGYNLANGGGGGFPAVEVVPGGGHVDLFYGANYIGGGSNGAAKTSGDVTAWAP